MKRKLTVIFLIFVNLLVFGQWHLIDDFQQWENGQIFPEATDLGWHAYSSMGLDEYWFFDYPDNSGNISLYLETPSEEGMWAMKELPNGGIGVGETGTLYFRYLSTDPESNLYSGTADRPLRIDDETGSQTAPGGWSDFNALVQLDDATLAHWDSEDFVSTIPEFSFEQLEWYEIWMVIRNTFEEVNGTWTSTGGYKTYVRGPDDANPVLIPVGSDPARDEAAFRRAPLDDDNHPQAIIWSMFATYNKFPSKSSADIYLIDDIYFSEGSNLHGIHVDPPTSWGGYDIANARSDVDSGEWLAWLNITQAPYIWSYSLNSWIYMEEPPIDASGAWAYFYK